MILAENFKNSSFFLVARLVCFAIPLFFFIGCKPDVQKRPYGFGKLGKVSGYYRLDVKEDYHNALLIRQDLRGLYAMSTLCTRELRRLKVKLVEGQPVLYCDVCGSEYDGDGHILKGPAKAGLPFYGLVVAEGIAGGPKDTLYARIGEEVGATWRLPFPNIEQQESSDAALK